MRNITITFGSGDKEVAINDELSFEARTEDWFTPTQIIIEGNIDESAASKIDDKTPQFMKFTFDSKIVSGMFISAEMSSLVDGMIWARFESVGKIKVVYK